MKYFHGGAPRIWPSRVLPPSVTGADSLATYGDTACRRDRVYVTSSVKAALIYAAFHPSDRGVVYEVVPEGELEPDTDCNDASLSFCCRSARIVREQPVTRAVRDAVRAKLLADKARHG